MGKKKQQGNGSGSVYPRKNKDGKIISYLGAYVVDGKTRYVSHKNKIECRNLLRQAMTEADKGVLYNAGTLKLKDYLDTWLVNIKGSIRQRSWERYEQLVRVHIKPALGNVKLKDLTRAHIKTMHQTCLENVSPTTVKYVHTTIHKALNEAVADNLVPKNVASGVKPPKKQEAEINPLTSDQAKALLNAARGDRYEALYVLAVYYGLRQGELLGLKWQDLDGKTLQVRRTMSETSTGCVEEKPKSGRGRRIDLSENVLEVLRSHGERMQAEGYGSELIFPSTVGTTTNSKNLYWRSYKPLL